MMFGQMREEDVVVVGDPSTQVGMGAVPRTFASTEG